MTQEKIIPYTRFLAERQTRGTGTYGIPPESLPEPVPEHTPTRPLPDETTPMPEVYDTQTYEAVASVLGDYDTLTLAATHTGKLITRFTQSVNPQDPATHDQLVTVRQTVRKQLEAAQTGRRVLIRQGNLNHEEERTLSLLARETSALRVANNILMRNWLSPDDTQTLYRMGTSLTKLVSSYDSLTERKY